jgi:hypothetical protein
LRGLGTARVQSYNERELRTAWWAFLRGNARHLALVALLFACIGALLTLVMSGYLLGMAHGVLAASYLWIVRMTFAAAGHSSRLYGQWGEQNSRDALRSARRRRYIYGFLDNLEIQGGDVDHLVLTPGGVLALDSKWHGQDITTATLERDRDRAVAAARRAKSILRSLGQMMEVQPVVVVWGGQQSGIPGGAIVRDGVPFVSGNDLARWLRRQRSDERQLSRADSAELLKALRAFRARVRPGA